MCVADDLTGGQSFNGTFERNQYATTLLGSLNIRRLPQDCPTTRFIVELHGQVDIFGIAASADQRPTGTRPLQNEECIYTATEPQSPADLLDGIFSGAFSGMMDD